VRVTLDAEIAGAAYVTGWLRGRYGDVEDRGVAAGYRRWRVVRGDPGPFEVEVSEDALDQDRVQLREWLETLAEDAVSGAPEPPGGYRVSRGQGVTKALAGLPQQRVLAGD
jgi:hypothetical protein